MSIKYSVFLENNGYNMKTMDKSYALIFFGCLAIIMSFGDDTFNFISSEIKGVIGILFIGYGFFKLYKSKRQS